MFTLYGGSREEHLLLTMFQSALSTQFEKATKLGSLVREDTPVIYMISAYTRRGPGQSYLKSVLAERINGLIERKDFNLEIDPAKVNCQPHLRDTFTTHSFHNQVYRQMVKQVEEETGSLPPNLPARVPPKVAQANPDVQAIIAPRLTMLMEITNGFLITIVDSMDSVPYGIRWICKQIRTLTRVRAYHSPIK